MLIARYLVLGLTLAAQDFNMGGFGGFGAGLYDGPALLGRGGNGVGATGSESIPIRLTTGVNGTYNSNILGFSVDEKGNYKPVASAGVEGNLNISGQQRFRRAYLGVNYNGGYSHYSRASFNNGSNQGLNIAAAGRVSGRWVVNGQGLAGISNRILGNYSYGSIAEAEFITAPTSELFDSRTYFMGVSSGATYYKDRRNSFRFAGSASTVRRKARSLADMQQYGATSDWVYRWNQRTSVGVSYQFYHYDFFKVFGDTDIHMIGVHIGRKIGRDWQLSVGATGMQQSTVGVRRIELEPVLAQLLGRSTGSEVFESNNLLYGGNVSIERTLRRLSYGVSLSRAITPGNGFFVSAINEGGDGHLRFSTSRRTSLDSRAGYMRMASLGFASGKLNSGYGGVGFSYQIVDAVSLQINGDSRSFSIEQATFRRKGYQISIGLAYHPSRGIFSTK